jgi:ABC-type transport system substrate-binding protein
MDRDAYGQRRVEITRPLTRREVLRLGGIGLAGAALLGVAGCGGERGGSQQGGGQGGTGGPAQEGGTLVLGVDAIQGNFDPGIFSTFGDWMALDCVARGLTHIDYESTEPQPGLAESWEVSEDGTVYTFELRDGVKFHDGNPLTATDCERSFMRLMDPDDPSRPPGTYAIAELGGENLKEVRTVDERTFEITLGAPDVVFLSRLANPNGAILSAAAIDEYKDEIGTNLVGAGPFRFVDAQPGQKVTLEAFDDYYEGSPKLDRVVLQVLPDPSALTSAMQSEQVQASNFLPYTSVSRLQSSGSLQVYEPEPFTSIFVEMNASVPVLKDLKVRQAINYAIDREAIIEEAFSGLGQQPAYIVCPVAIGYDESLNDFSTQDMERAKELLAEAGAEGETVGLLVQNILFWPKVGQIVTSNLEELGLKVEAEYLDSGTFNGRAFDPEGHELICTQRSAFIPDPEDWLAPLYAGDSFVTQSSTVADKLPVQAEIDQMLEDGRQETDEGRREDLYVELQRLLAEEQMVRAMLAYVYAPTASSANLAGFNATALSNYRVFLEEAGFSG